MRQGSPDRNQPVTGPGVTNECPHKQTEELQTAHVRIGIKRKRRCLACHLVWQTYEVHESTLLRRDDLVPIIRSLRESLTQVESALRAGA